MKRQQRPPALRIQIEVLPVAREVLRYRALLRRALTYLAAPEGEQPLEVRAALIADIYRALEGH